MDDSDSSSSLSSALQSDDERLAPIFLKAKGAKSKVGSSPATTISPPKPKRAPSPPHEDTFADNPDIAFLVMFRSRFSSAFPPKLPNLGPQDIERGVSDITPSPQVENLLCALLGLVLNRKKPVERGHHGRALEEAMTSQKSQWPHSWQGVNPLHGNRNFQTMAPLERLNLLRTLVLWSLSSSDIISATIKDAYKHTRADNDVNLPLSVQPWGKDGDNRNYWLIEGLDDTNFRLYRESSRALKTNTWWNMAGSIDEIKEVATKLDKEATQASRRLSARIMSAIPRFEATEEKRRRREYRQMQRARFTRPELGLSLYEGRTRGKRMRYTFDDEAEDSDDFSLRRSGRNSDRSTPGEAGPTVTASGRQVRQRGGGVYGESLLSGAVTNADTPMTNDDDGSDGSEIPRNNGNRATRSGGRVSQLSGNRKRKFVDGYNDVDQLSDEEDATSSGNEWDGGDDDDDHVDDNVVEEEDDDDEMDDNEVSDDEEDELLHPASLIVKLKIGPSSKRSTPFEAAATTGGADTSMMDTDPPPSASASEAHPSDHAHPKLEPALNGGSEILSSVVPDTHKPDATAQVAAPTTQHSSQPIGIPSYTHAHPPPVAEAISSKPEVHQPFAALTDYKDHAQPAVQQLSSM